MEYRGLDLKSTIKILDQHRGIEHGRGGATVL